jgi:hypothetical protein
METILVKMFMSELFLLLVLTVSTDFINQGSRTDKTLYFVFCANAFATIVTVFSLIWVI